MSVAPAPTLFVIAGPNGAGKSSLYDVVFRARLALPFVNADLIQRDRLCDTDARASYAAARLAETERRRLIAARESFVMETVFSHPSKLDLLRAALAAGYRVAVHHVGVASDDLSVDRVALRVRRGGHPVPEDKIRARYARNGAIIREAVLLAQRGTVWDNSVHARPPVQVLRFAEGMERFRAAPLPGWAAAIYG